jgi:hypothetical protein
MTESVHVYFEGVGWGGAEGSNVVIFGVTREKFVLMAADELKAIKFI